MYVLLVSSVIMLHVNNIQQVKKLTEQNQDLQKVNVWKVTVNQLSMEKQDVKLCNAHLHFAFDTRYAVHVIPSHLLSTSMLCACGVCTVEQ